MKLLSVSLQRLAMQAQKQRTGPAAQSAAEAARLGSPFALRPSGAALAVLFALAGLVLVGAAALRGVEYDEGYTVFLAAGAPRPVWPDAPFQAGTMRGAYAGQSTLAGIADDLRRGDVHPPLYFWAVAAWRAALGTSLFATRLFSVACSLGAIAAIAAIARRCAVPPLPAMLLTVLCYGFSYTGAIARGFALAEFLTLAGVALLLAASRRQGAFAAGLLLGAASYANYLAAFAGGAALLWSLLRRRGLALPAIVGFALVLPADLFFFLAQRGSRTDQFPQFRMLPSLARLAQYAAANVFGGLPLYAGGARAVVTAAVALLLAGAIGLVAWRWRRIATPETRLLLAMAAAAPPAGLILLGLVFDTTPIELRYLSFAVPFAMLLLAGGIATLPPRGWVLGAVGAIQALAIAGMLLRPETMQPQGQAARDAAALAGPDGLVLVPFGNDGVGVLSAVVSAAPDATRILAVRAGDAAEKIVAIAAGFPRVAIVRLGLDGDSRAVLPVLDAAFPSACWRDAGERSNVRGFDRIC
jgi:hypothetical protein